jgi:hypothetical protein
MGEETDAWPRPGVRQNRGCRQMRRRPPPPSSGSEEPPDAKRPGSDTAVRGVQDGPAANGRPETVGGSDWRQSRRLAVRPEPPAASPDETAADQATNSLSRRRKKFKYITTRYFNCELMKRTDRVAARRESIAASLDQARPTWR